MNKIDIVNIKNELAKRKAANYEWKDGGEMTKNDVMLRTIKELTELKDNYEKSIEKSIFENIHKLVDDIFKKYAEDDDNMIPLSCAYRPEYRIYEDIGINIYDSISFTDRYNHNPYIKPIGRDWSKDDDQWEKYSDDLDKLINEIYKDKTKIPDAEEFWKDKGERLNEYWYGVIAITRDYKIVGFEIRDDGLAQNDNKLNYPNIITV